MRTGRPPRSIAEIDADIIQQLLTHYKITAGGCWVWSGKYFANGYGRIARYLPRAHFHMRAHIAAYQFYKGYIPKGLFVCHRCDVKGCINPDHLWLGTNKENQDDAVKKGVFEKYWTAERRKERSSKNSGSGNPMFGKTGPLAPCYGRTGDKHPMFKKHHSEESRLKISASLTKTFKEKRENNV